MSKAGTEQNNRLQALYLQRLKNMNALQSHWEVITVNKEPVLDFEVMEKCPIKGRIKVFLEVYL